MWNPQHSGSVNVSWQSDSFMLVGGGNVVIFPTKINPFQIDNPFAGIKPPAPVIHNPLDVDPSTIGRNLPLFGGRSSYAGGDNPMDYAGNYTYRYVPTRLEDYPAIGHDRRYDKLGIQGAKGLFFDSRAIGADYRFVYEQYSLASTPGVDNVTQTNAMLLGTGLGLFALPKTLWIFASSYPGMAMPKIISWYYISSAGVTNYPDK